MLLGAPLRSALLWLQSSSPHDTLRAFARKYSVYAGSWVSSGEGRLLVANVKLDFFAYMARKLFVGGLPYRTTGDELKDAFSQAGEVASASIVTDRETGRSRGFGFVEMAEDSDAEKAISMWNGKEFGGRTLTVSEARPKA